MPITGATKAKMVARLGIMRIGASRLDYYNPVVKITINGVDRSTTGQVRVEGLSIRDLLDGTPNTATIRVDGFTPVKGHEVKMALGQLDLVHYVFAGHILSTTQVYEGKPANVAWDLNCISYEWLLNRRKVTKRYTNQTATAIVLDLIASFTSGFTTTNVTTGLAVIDEITFTNEEVTDALDRIVRRVGAYWYVDYAKDLHVFTAATESAHSMTDSDDHGAFAIAQAVDLSQMRTRMYIEGGGSTASVEIAVGAPTLPVEDMARYNASGGTVVAGPQRIIYTGKGANEGLGSTVRGKPLAPGTISSASAVAGTSGNLGVGTFGYRTTYVTSNGESELAGSATTGTISHVAAPTGTASGVATTGGSLTSSAWYGWEVTFVTAAGETVGGPGGTALLGASDTAISLTNIPTSADGRVTKRRIYRTGANFALGYLLDTTITDNTTTTATLTKADTALGVTMPATNTSGSGQMSLTGVPTGPAGTTARKLYRTVADGPTSGYENFAYVGTIGNNSGTTFTDNTSDTGRAATAPSDSAVGALAGDTTLRVADQSLYAAAGGWLLIDNQIIRFTGRTASSGEGNLTGVPASGVGSITASIAYGTVAKNAPHLTGVSGVLYTIKQGEPVNLLVTRNDATAQSNMAGFVGGDGIVEDYIQDNRLSETEAIDRGDAQLALAKDPLVTMTYQTHDQTTRSGREVTFSLSAPTSISGTYKIQSVTLSGFDPLGRTFPLRQVEASSRRFSFEQILRLLKAA